MDAAIRVVHLADLVEVYHRRGGVTAAIEVARRRSSTQLDPQMVEVFLTHATELLDDLPTESGWDALIAADPSPRNLHGDQLDAALEAVADFVDLKSPYFAGHSRGVADLAAAAARRAGHPGPEVQTLRRAALLHDFGRTGVPNTIWDKPGPLIELEWARVRLHSYYTDRMLRRPALLAELGAVAALAHERRDCSGYHRGLSGTAIPALARLLAAADCYHAMREARPHRPPHPPDAAAQQLRAVARAGALDPAAVEAVLGSAGHRPRRAAAGPAGLTPREVEVLVLLARAASTRQIAHRLGIAPKTAGNHIERIYTKTGASTRAGRPLRDAARAPADPRTTRTTRTVGRTPHDRDPSGTYRCAMTTSAARHATASTVIPADPDQVFALLTDIDRLPSWNTELTTVLERPDELVPARNGSSRCTPPA